MEIDPYEDVNTAWPFFILPQKDELLSSWICRSAYAHNYKLQTFCHINWPGMQIWNRDIDRFAKEELILKISTKSHVQIEQARETLLSSFEGNLFLKHTQLTNTPWIMPLGIFHRDRKHTGLMICPVCLRKDLKPYYRKAWRLSLSVCCIECGTLLTEKCPICNSPIIFHRTTMGNGKLLLKDSITECFKCGYDLRNSPTQEAANEIIQYQIYFNESLIKGYNDKTQYSHLFFTIAHQLLNILSSKNPKAQKLKSAINDATGFLKIETEHTPFDRKCIYERIELLCALNWILKDWPARFIYVCKENKIASSILFKDLKEIPYWYWNVITEHLYIKHNWQYKSMFDIYRKWQRSGKIII